MHYNANNRSTSFNILPQTTGQETKKRMHLRTRTNTRAPPDGTPLAVSTSSHNWRWGGCTCLLCFLRHSTRFFPHCQGGFLRLSGIAYSREICVRLLRSAARYFSIRNSIEYAMCPAIWAGIGFDLQFCYWLWCGFSAPGFYYNITTILRKLGQIKETEECLKKAIRINRKKENRIPYFTRFIYAHVR